MSHKTIPKTKQNIDTSSWRFIDNVLLKAEYFDPYDNLMPSTQQKQSDMKNINEEISKRVTENVLNDDEVYGNENKGDTENKEHINTSDNNEKELKEQETDLLIRRLKEHDVQPNPYLVLVNRLDEEEGIRVPTIEDKLKLVEDRLRVSTAEFSKYCEKLLDPEDTNSDEHENEFISFDSVQKAFKPKVFDLSLPPPQPLQISNMSSDPTVDLMKNDTQNMIQKQTASRKQKHGFYLPVSTWFTQKDERVNPTEEEQELLNSTSTKEFLQFLKERKNTPPKILTEIKNKLENLQSEISGTDNK